MHELQQLLKRFLARQIELGELQRRFASLLDDDSALAPKAAAWLDAGEHDGRLSAAVCTSLKNVIVAHLAASSDGPDPRRSGIFDELGLASQEIVMTDAEEETPRDSKPDDTYVRSSQGTRLGTRDADEHNAPRQAAGLPSVLEIGSLISERYELVSELGSGGMGRVFKARDRLYAEARDRDPFVALKVLSERFKAHPDSMIALQREAHRAQTLAHPNVTTVHAFFRDGPHYYLTMELLHGAPLDEIVTTEYSNGIPLEAAWPIIESVGLALQYGHEKGIVHSDVKPGNIFLCDDGTIKVLDFGISRPIPIASIPESEQTVFDPGKRLGSMTPAYASLEMWHQDVPDARDDVYALACVAYLLLTGRHPFGGKSAKDAFNSNLEPAGIESITRSQWNAIANGLRFRRRDRTASVTKFLTALSPQTVARSRRRMAILLSAFAATLLAAIGVWYMDDMKEAEREMEREMERDRQVAELVFERARSTAEPFNGMALSPDEIGAQLELARLDLDNVNPEWDANLLVSALSKGPNNVLERVQMVLSSDEKNDAARALQDDIFKIFIDKASVYRESRDYEAALKIALTAGEIKVDSSVGRLIRDICEVDNPPVNCPQKTR